VIYPRLMPSDTRDRMRKRLLAVQGPLQFIAGYLAMKWYERAQNNSEQSQSVLLLYDFLAPASIEPEFVEIITRIAAVQKWHSVVFIGGKEMNEILAGYYAGSMEKLRHAVGEDHFDEIYLARDYCGYGSPLIINAYKNAARVMYGDSLGIVGNEAAISGFNWDSPIIAVLSYCKRFLKGRIYGKPVRLRFDAAVLTLPIACSRGYLDGTPLLVPSIEFVTSGVKSIYDNLGGLSGC
jgi:hypothetical protein